MLRPVAANALYRRIFDSTKAVTFIGSCKYHHVKGISGPTQPQKRFRSTQVENTEFNSIVDNPPTLVRTGRRHGPGLIILGEVCHNYRRAY
jgi:hypothetical protein